MKKYIIIVITVSCLGSFLLAQQGKYKRKSVSSLGMIWSNGKLHGLDENYKTLINRYIEVPRFDYNNLPQKIVNQFYQKSKNINDFNRIESLLEEIVIKEIEKILNDPEVQKE